MSDREGITPHLPAAADIRYFVEVAKTGNLSRAAERLGVSQPSLSLAIKRLEDAVGVSLMLRGKSGVKLTKPGQRFVGEAKHLLERWDELRTTARKEENELIGSYTIGCHVSVGLYALASFVPGLLKEHPSLEIKLVHDLSRKVTERVISFEADFGIVVNPVAHPDLVIKPLFKDEVTFWIGAGGDRGCLICDPDLLQTQSLMKSLKKKGISFGRVLPTSSLEIVSELTRSGAGVGVIPSRVAKRFNVKRAGDEFPVFEDEICLVYRADLQKTAAAKLMLRAIESGLKGL